MKIIVHVKPNSKEEYFSHVKENEYCANLISKAEKGEANNELINLIAKSFKVKWQNVIIKNPKSKKKVVEIIKV